MDTSAAIKGIVLFADGGTRPNPGFGGYGIHGYTYNAVSPSKGLGRNFITTSQGYVDKNAEDIVIISKDDSCAQNNISKIEQSLVSVTPITYVDITGSISGTSTNNTAEVIAMTQAFRYVLNHCDAQLLKIFTDSEYTKNGTNEWIDNWARNNWVKSDGNPVINKDLWISLKESRDAVIAKGIRVSVEWVRGHDGDVGNEKADTLASMGVFDAQRGVVSETVKETEAECYWKNTVTRHPFIAHRRCYFSSKSELVPGVYHLGDHGKDDELLGKKSSDGCYSVVQLLEPDSVLDLIRKYQSSLTGYSDSIFAVHLDQVYNSDIHKSLSLFGEKGLEPPSGYRLDIKYADKTPITREFKPPRLAWRSINELSELEVLLEKFKTSSPDVTVNDITENLYDVVEKKIPPKKGKSEGTIETSTKLKSDIVVGCTDITVKCKLTSSGQEILEDLKLTLGIDILDRNALKKLETLSPKVCVITWTVSDVAYRYATIVKTTNDIGIWCGVYSNLRILGTVTK
jgi:ribonuclease HI